MQPKKKNQNRTDLDQTAGCSCITFRIEGLRFTNQLQPVSDQLVWLKCVHQKYLQNEPKIIETYENLTEINYY